MATPRLEICVNPVNLCLKKLFEGWRVVLQAPRDDIFLYFFRVHSF